MSLRFHKWHGLGNDFVLLDLRDHRLPVDAALARRLADRHLGIGCDQLLVLRAPAGADHLARFEIWNADGSTAEQCGNGMRAIGRHLQLAGEAPAGGFRLRGPAGDVGLECLADGQVRVDMGRPRFAPAEVPTTLAPADGWYSLELAGRALRFGAASMGNPHVVVPVSGFGDDPLHRFGPALSTHPAFPEGCNVGFALLHDPARLELRVWERGAGETRACGSGACAAVAVLRRSGQAGPRVTVAQAGGELVIEWDGGEGPVLMTGPAVHVFDGTME